LSWIEGELGLSKLSATMSLVMSLKDACFHDRFPAPRMDAALRTTIDY
jgi:hypothetical protein